MPATVYLVIPCYNEAEVLPETAARLLRKLGGMTEGNLINERSKILFVDDGSADGTWKLITELHAGDGRISGVKLSRNRGHQNALLAGLMAAESADVTISMDADLQDDIECLDLFVQKYYEGCEIVYGVRSDRAKDSPFKRGTALAFYKLMKILGVNIVFNHADYRLLSRRALTGLAAFKEANLFLRGVVPLIGYRSATVTYARGERFAGQSKYPLKKMLSFAWDGITSFSTRPIRLISALGFFVFLSSFALMLYSLVRNLSGHTVQGWSTLMISIWLLGGLQLLALGIIGEYIGKIYNEVKARPKYIIEEVLDEKEPGETQ